VLNVAAVRPLRPHARLPLVPPAFVSRGQGGAQARTPLQQSIRAIKHVQRNVRRLPLPADVARCWQPAGRALGLRRPGTGALTRWTRASKPCGQPECLERRSLREIQPSRGA
jgi:hypothetical protein